MQIRHGQGGDEQVVGGFLAEHHSSRVARSGRLMYPLEHPALLAVAGDELLGVLTYVVDGRLCEILTLHAANQWSGIGTVLVDEVRRVASAAGCTTLWLVTTNDNVDALRFYQRRGFRLAALHTGAADASRTTLKPEIPHVGAYGIPLHDELELYLPLRPRRAGSATS